jgi:dihydroxyacid dehydratase/phosphogluconate dehydratase
MDGKAKVNAIAEGKQPLTTDEAKAVAKAARSQRRRKAILDFKAKVNAANVKLAMDKQPLTTDEI